MFKIDATNRIIIDDQITGLAVIQRRNKTVVYTPESQTTRYAEHKMPADRYSLTHAAPASGAAGRDQFEADVRALLKQ